MRFILLLLALISLLVPVFVHAQSNEEKALKLGNEAIELMDNGKIAQGLALLEEAKKLDPSKSIYSYEMAYGNYAAGNYKKAIKILEDILDAPDGSDLYYQLLGNAYDNDGNGKKATKVYEAGLAKYPNSGKLYLESGIQQLGFKEFNTALTLFEKGIDVEPDFPSNYYWAAKLFLGASEEEVWGMIYGELFMNMERNSKRTAEISKMLYDTYKSEIAFTSDTSMSVSFSKNATIEISDATDLANIKLPYGVSVYEPVLSIALVGEQQVTPASLDRIRSRFIDIYFQQNQHVKYPNALFTFVKTVKDAGHMEAYNHWILMKGDETDFELWRTSNPEKWEAFIEWFKQNKIALTQSNKFVRSQYR
jgi:tetratricopeptide (TPR) repeat protein